MPAGISMNYSTRHKIVKCPKALSYASAPTLFIGIFALREKANFFKTSYLFFFS